VLTLVGAAVDEACEGDRGGGAMAPSRPALRVRVGMTPPLPPTRRWPEC